MPMKKMKKRIRDQWIGALKSGVYPQGRSLLAKTPEGELDAERYCCLGVLCTIVAPGDRNDNKEESCFTDAKGWSGKWGTLPPYMRKLTGLTDEKAIGKLIIMNDTKHYSFRQIAAWIKRYL
jgi:hypothetical protein